MSRSPVGMFHEVLKLGKSARKVQAVLQAHGLVVKVMQLPDSTHTAQNAADTIGCSLAQIVKSLIFKTKDEQPVLVLASGPNQVDLAAVSALHGQPVMCADAKFVKSATGFIVGGTPPLGHVAKGGVEINIPTYVDRDLADSRENLWAAAGNPNAVFEISPEDLLRVIFEPRVVDIKMPEESEAAAAPADDLAGQASSLSLGSK